MSEVWALTWTSPSGLACPLSVSQGLPTFGWMAMPGVVGLGAGDVNFTEDPLPTGGTNVRKITTPTRNITLPLYVCGATPQEFLQRWETLGDALTQTAEYGPGRLSATRIDGTTRVINAYYSGGWDNAENSDTAGIAAVTLHCPDPYWRDDTLTWIARSQLSGSVSFLSPFPTVSTSHALGDSFVTNHGTVKAWPTWRITGPASSLEATNNTTGESFVLDVVAFRGTPLASGEDVTIATSPPAVTGPTGANWAGALEWPTSTLWGLDRGVTSVSFVATGGGTTTEVAASFYGKYRSA